MLLDAPSAARQGRVLWFSSGNTNDEVVGWFDTKKWDATHDEAASQGWAPFIVDTNGNGKVDAYVGPDDAVDPGKDKHVKVGFLRLFHETLIFML